MKEIIIKYDIISALFHCTCREEGEKLNLWIGLLNLENMYGDGESLNKVFNRALQQNDPLTVYNKMIDIYVTSNKNNVRYTCAFHLLLLLFLFLP